MSWIDNPKDYGVFKQLIRDRHKAIIYPVDQTVRITDPMG